VRGKTCIFIISSLSLSFSHLTALPGGKNLMTGQAVRAGGGKRLQ